MRFWILDTRETWFGPAIETAKRRGYEGQRIFRGDVIGPGIGFIRPHADPVELQKNRNDFDLMASQLTMIQDRTQVRVYESKSAQFNLWRDWMPDTWRFESEAEAMTFAETAELPIVSKADVGASSINVRIIRDRQQLVEHVGQIFGRGVDVNHCAGGPGGRLVKTLQKGYAILQRFIPHQITWRVNAIGNSRAIFKRYCYPDRQVAQTGNVEPVMRLDAETESLLEFADRWFAHAGTKWCAIDVLKDGDRWRFIECSCAWPWPSPGACNEAPLFRSRNRQWKALWECMFDEVEAGAWGG